jgi:glycosyltransferase involved in cell wall biosynthesis
LLEALGCGNAVIAHDNPFNREVASDCAIYFSSSSQISDIVTSLEIGIDNDFATKARERIRKIYSWDLITDQYQKLIQDAVSAVRKRFF